MKIKISFESGQVYFKVDFKKHQHTSTDLEYALAKCGVKEKKKGKILKKTAKVINAIKLA